jgi:hypothetical protein
MRTKIAAGAVIAVVASYWAASTHGQVQSVPGPGSGMVMVQGEVDIRRLPAIDVGQRGDWKMSLASVADVRVVNAPTVVPVGLTFLRAGSRYDITWSAGDRETIAVAELGSGGWVRATVGGRQRWLNLSVARAIEDAQ